MEKTYVIVGGGAAGVFAAIRCKHQNPLAKVILLEKTNQLLAKVRISGGGRCNVTHACFDPAKLVQNYPRGSKELLGPFHSFQPKDTIQWFEERGVALKTENDGRMFPTTDSSETVIECLLSEAFKVGVDIRKQQRILSIIKTDGHFVIELPEEKILTCALLLATGSTPWGHAIAQALGHHIIHPVPSLFTFNIPTSPLLDLSGIVAPHVTIALKETPYKQSGPLLLTHWGFSGPAALRLSAWAARALYEVDYKATLLINWICAPNSEMLYQDFLKKKEENPFQTVPPLLPSKLLARLIENMGADPSMILGKWPNKMLAELAKKLFADAYAVDGKTTYKQEFVTAGGIDLKEVDFKTMQSRITPGLFFAGEILNIDGVTGGFNFQNAWTTGWLAGSSMASCSS